MLKKIFHFSITLALICAVCIFCVSLVYSLTSKDIARKEYQKKLAALSIILKDLRVSEQSIPFNYKTEKDEKQYQIYLGMDKKTGKVKGWGVQVGKQGYSSVVQTMVGVDENNKIIAIEVVFQQETPGLGAECESTGAKKLSSLWTTTKVKAKRPWFQAQYSHKSVDQLKLRKGITVISGATITSSAVNRGVRQALKIIQAFRHQKQKS